MNPNYSSNSLMALSGAATLLIAWEAGARLAGQGIDLPAPSSALRAIEHNYALFLHHSMVSVSVAVAGLTVALVTAFVSASVFALSRRVTAALTPLVIASQTAPLVALEPLLSSVIGSGTASAILLTAWMTWFPAMIAFTHGFLKVHPDRLALFHVAGATRWQTFLRLRLPGSAASLVAGIRASAGFALIGAIVVEYGQADQGLGALIIRHTLGTQRMASDALFGLVIISSFLGVLLTWIAHQVARLLLRQYLRADA